MVIVCYALSAYWFILIARIILSWVTMTGWSPPPSMAPVMRVIYDLTEPLLGLFRRYIPPVGMLDLSPLFIFIILGFVQRALCS
jgi:YggT family protein